jgi:hypothetical protein
MGAGGPGTAPAPGLHGLAEAMGGREDVLVGRSEPQDEQGLRAPAAELRGVHIRGYDTAHGEAVSTLMRLFRGFLTAFVKNIGPTTGCTGIGLDSC